MIHNWFDRLLEPEYREEIERLLEEFPGSRFTIAFGPDERAYVAVITPKGSVHFGSEILSRGAEEEAEEDAREEMIRGLVDIVRQVQETQTEPYQPREDREPWRYVPSDDPRWTYTISTTDGTEWVGPQPSTTSGGLDEGPQWTVTSLPNQI